MLFSVLPLQLTVSPLGFWTLPSLNLDMYIDVNRGFSLISENKIANSVDPDETAHYEAFHLDLHCLHRSMFQSTGLKSLKQFCGAFKKTAFSLVLAMRYMVNVLRF